MDICMLQNTELLTHSMFVKRKGRWYLKAEVTDFHKNLMQKIKVSAEWYCQQIPENQNVKLFSVSTFIFSFSKFRQC